MNIFKRWLLKQVASGMNQQLNSVMLNGMNYGAAWTPTNVESLVEKGYSYNATVYSIVNIIIGACARANWELYRVKEEKHLARYKSMAFENPTVKAAMKTKALDRVGDHKLLEVWNNPNPNQSNTEFISQNIGFKLVTGNAYMYGVGPDTGANSGQFQELWNLPSQIMRVKVKSMTAPIEGYTTQLDPGVHIEPAVDDAP